MKITLLVLFFAVMVGVGIYCRKSASDVQGFVLGSRNVGSWLTAFSFGTSYFSAVIFVGYAFGIDYAWCVLAMLFGLVVVPAVSIFGKKEDKQRIDAMFGSCRRGETVFLNAYLTLPYEWCCDTRSCMLIPAEIH